MGEGLCDLLMPPGVNTFSKYSIKWWTWEYLLEHVLEYLCGYSIGYFYTSSSSSRGYRCSTTRTGSQYVWCSILYCLTFSAELNVLIIIIQTFEYSNVLDLYVENLVKRLMDTAKKMLYWHITNQQSWEVPYGRSKAGEAKQWIIKKSGTGSV